MNETNSVSPFVAILWLAIYIYAGYAFMTIAKKLGEPNGWFAFVPILNIYLMVKLAGKPGWWMIFFFIPLVNIVVSVMVLWHIAIRLGKSGWLGVAMIVPLVNLVVLYFLAFDSGTPTPPARTEPPAIA